MNFKWIVSLALGVCVVFANAEEIVSIDDSRFTDAAAKEGVRAFDTFPFAGMYSLEEFDPLKPVVVLVHGANGHPGNFKEVAQEAQARGAQVWLPYYPTGVSLTLAGAYVANQVLVLAKERGVRELTVIAHSMGGLVALDAVALISEGGVVVKQLTTVASPFGGVGAARLGVWFSPNPQDNWRDLVPGSPFLGAIHERKVNVALVLFAVERAPGALTDGVIPLSSQLQPDMVHKAKSVRQLQGTHVGVLFDSETVREVIEASV